MYISSCRLIIEQPKLVRNPYRTKAWFPSDNPNYNRGTDAIK